LNHLKLYIFIREMFDMRFWYLL